MKQFNVRVSDEIYDKVKHKAKAQGISVSEFVRDVVINACEEDSEKHQSQRHEAAIWLKEELDKRNEEIHAFRSTSSEERQRHDTIVLQMTKQLENVQHQLEDFRKPQPRWWERRKKTG